MNEDKMIHIGAKVIAILILFGFYIAYIFHAYTMWKLMAVPKGAPDLSLKYIAVLSVLLLNLDTRSLTTLLIGAAVRFVAFPLIILFVI